MKKQMCGVILWALLNGTIFFLSGCAADLTADNTVDIATDIRQIRESQVENNIIAAIQNPYADSAPSHIVLTTGQADVTAGNSSAGLVLKSPLRYGLVQDTGNFQELDLGFNIQWKDQWQFVTPTDQKELLRLRDLYNLVLPLKVVYPKLCSSRSEEECEEAAKNNQITETFRKGRKAGHILTKLIKERQNVFNALSVSPQASPASSEAKSMTPQTAEKLCRKQKKKTIDYCTRDAADRGKTSPDDPCEKLASAHDELKRNYAAPPEPDEKAVQMLDQIIAERQADRQARHVLKPCEYANFQQEKTEAAEEKAEESEEADEIASARKDLLSLMFPSLVDLQLATIKNGGSSAPADCSALDEDCKLALDAYKVIFEGDSEKCASALHPKEQGIEQGINKRWIYLPDPALKLTNDPEEVTFPSGSADPSVIARVKPQACYDDFVLLIQDQLNVTSKNAANGTRTQLP